MELQLKAYLEELFLIESVLSLLNWDMEVHLPKEAIEFRSKQLEYFTALVHKKVIDPHFHELVEKGLDLTKPHEKRMHHLLKIRIDRATKLPVELVEKISQAETKATHAWKEAREKDNFKLFQAPLENLVALKREQAERLGYKNSPYEALFALYEPDLSLEEVDELFREVKAYLLTKIPKVLSSSSPGYKSLEFEADKELALSKAILSRFTTSVHVNASTHPFCNRLGLHDVRITNRPSPNDFFDPIATILHEMGHALYELNLPENHPFDPLGQPLSLTLHESQSKFFENFIGLSPQFFDSIYDDIIETFPQLQSFDKDSLYRQIHQIHYSPIRLESDELTYPLHIILRYELERDLINGKLEVRDLPRAFKEKQKQFLHLEVTSDREGCLQDCHWGGGLFGYFPTYLLGTLVAAQLFDAMERSLGKLSSILRQKEYHSIVNWLKTHIHQQGSIYRLQDLLERATKEKLEAKHLLLYFDQHYPDTH